MRVRTKVAGSAHKPRLSVFRSNTRLAAQVIDDESGVTLVSVSSSDIVASTRNERIRKAGEKLAEELKKRKVKEVVFDRGGFLYTGNVKLFADSVREGGIIF